MPEDGLTKENGLGCYYILPTVHQQPPPLRLRPPLSRQCPLAHSHLDSFAANQVQLMIISCPVSLHLRQASGWRTRPNQGAGITQPCTALVGPALGHSSLWQTIERTAKEGLVNTKRSLGEGMASPCHTLDSGGLLPHNQPRLPLIIHRALILLLLFFF